MARKQSKRAEILAKIREIRGKIEEKKMVIDDCSKVIIDIEKILADGLASTGKDFRLHILQANKLKAERKARFAAKSIVNYESTIESLEQMLLDLIAKHATEGGEDKADGAGGKESEWYVDSDGRRRKKEIEPGWRWISGYEDRYVWSTTGHVGVLKKSGYASYWIIKTIKAMGGKRLGVFNLSVAGIVERKAFSTIVEESKHNPLVARFIEDRGMDAQMVGIEGKEGLVICRF